MLADHRSELGCPCGLLQREGLADQFFEAGGFHAPPRREPLTGGELGYDRFPSRRIVALPRGSAGGRRRDGARGRRRRGRDPARAAQGACALANESTLSLSPGDDEEALAGSYGCRLSRPLPETAGLHGPSRTRSPTRFGPADVLRSSSTASRGLAAIRTTSGCLGGVARPRQAARRFQATRRGTHRLEGDRRRGEPPLSRVRGRELPGLPSRIRLAAMHAGPRGARFPPRRRPQRARLARGGGSERTT
jgi:hypothetical protein